MIATIFIFSSIFFAVLSLSSSQKGTVCLLPSGATFMATRRWLFTMLVWQGARHRRAEPGPEMARRCSSMPSPLLAAHGRLKSPVSTSVAWEGAWDGMDC